MLPRAHPGSAPFPPEEWLIRRVVSEREGLVQLHSILLAMESEPSTWFAPSRDAYLRRLGAVGDELSRAIVATDALADELTYAQLQNARLEDEQAQWLRALVVGS